MADGNNVVVMPVDETAILRRELEEERNTNAGLREQLECLAKDCNALQSQLRLANNVLDQCRRDADKVINDKRTVEAELKLWRAMFQETVKNVALSPVFPGGVHSFLDDVREEDKHMMLYTNRARCLSDVISVNEFPAKYQKEFPHGACITRIEPLPRPTTLQHSETRNSVRYVFRYRIAPLCAEENKPQ